MSISRQGVSSAVADAVGLARELAATSDIPAALSNYFRDRRQQCEPFVTKGRELMENFLKPQGAFVDLPIAHNGG